MSKSKILLQLDSDLQPSVFDSVVAIDAGVDCLLRHGGVMAADVTPLVHGAIFTRGVDELRHTAIFVGGSDVSQGELLLKAVQDSFFGPFRVSVLMDSNGANTTAAAAVLAAAEHVRLSRSTALVLGGTGPVGQRIVRLLAAEKATVRVGSRNVERAQAVCDAVAAAVSGDHPTAHSTATVEEQTVALLNVDLVIAAGAAGVELLSAEARRDCPTLAVAIDLNAVPPVGIAGVEPTDRAKVRDGVTCYGALGVGGAKMKIHKAALRRLFKSNDQVFDAEQILEIGRQVLSA